MTVKNKKAKKQTKPSATPAQRNAQVLFGVIALIVILSMVFSATTNY